MLNNIEDIIKFLKNDDINEFLIDNIKKILYSLIKEYASIQITIYKEYTSNGISENNAIELITQIDKNIVKLITGLVRVI